MRMIRIRTIMRIANPPRMAPISTIFSLLKLPAMQTKKESLSVTLRQKYLVLLLADSEAGLHSNPPSSVSRQMEPRGHAASMHAAFTAACSHVAPVNPDPHTQVNSRGLSEIHIPSFSHGSGSQGSTSAQNTTSDYANATLIIFHKRLSEYYKRLEI